MKIFKLLPIQFKILGWAILVISILLMILDKVCDMQNVLMASPNYLNNTVYYGIFNRSSVGILIGLLIISFTEHPTEDEFIRSIRLRSWHFAILSTYLIILIGMAFLPSDYLLIINIIGIPLIFQITFQFNLYQLKKDLNEK